MRAAFLVLGLGLLVLATCGDAAPGQTCDPGAHRCSGNRYEQCSDDGVTWVIVTDCGSERTCSSSSGCVGCSAGARSCDGADIVRCRDDGSGTDCLATCDPAVGDVCDNGACVNACALASQVRSYEGCEYWAVDLDNAVVADQGAAAAQQFSVVLSNASAVSAQVTIEAFCTAIDAANPAVACTEGQPFVVDGPFPVAPGALRIVDLDPREVDGSSRPELNDGPGTFQSRHAFRIASTAPLIVYQFNPLENVGVFSNDASLLLPTASLGDRYLTLSWPQTIALTDSAETNMRIDLRAFLTIVGVEDDTTVDVDLSTAILGGGGIPAAAAGETITVHLDRFDVVNLETDAFNADLTSTVVRARAGKSVAVFAGSEASDVPRFESLAGRRCCADHLEEQLFPTSSFGTQFVAVKTPLRSARVDAAGWDVSVVPDEPEYWRVIAARDDTTVTTDLPPPFHEIVLDRGQAAILESERDFLLDSDGPIAFGQFPGSQQTTGIPSTLPDGQRPPGGDPSYITVPPLEQWRTEYLFLVPNKYAFDFVLLAVPAGAAITYDGIDLTVALDCEIEPIGRLRTGPMQIEIEYVAYRCALSDPRPGGGGTQDDGVHRIESPSRDPFGLVVWGWDSFVSYGYPGGSNVSVINPD